MMLQGQVSKLLTFCSIKDVQYSYSAYLPWESLVVPFGETLTNHISLDI